MTMNNNNNDNDHNNNLIKGRYILTWDEIVLLEKKLTFDLVTQSPLFSPHN